MPPMRWPSQSPTHIIWRRPASPKTARPEPVEGLIFSLRRLKERQGFDKLSPNGDWGAKLIARLSGILAETSADGAVIDVRGVGYLVQCSGRTFDAIGPIGGE